MMILPRDKRKILMKIYISALLLSPHASRRKNENKSENVKRSRFQHMD